MKSNKKLFYKKFIERIPDSLLKFTYEIFIYKALLFKVAILN